MADEETGGDVPRLLSVAAEFRDFPKHEGAVHLDAGVARSGCCRMESIQPQVGVGEGVGTARTGPNRHVAVWTRRNVAAATSDALRAS